MPYTVLRVTEAGVVLWDYHLRRLEVKPGRAAYVQLHHFAQHATPGVWAAWSDARDVRVERRPGSRLRDGMPVRFVTSPVADRIGWISKPGSPSCYDRVRLDGWATLLTSPDGREIYEACSAAVVGFDGDRIVCVPHGCPRVWSTAENAIREHLRTRDAAILTTFEAILLVNAVKGTCTLAHPFSRAFPVEVRNEIEDLFARLTRRPATP